MCLKRIGILCLAIMLFCTACSTDHPEVKKEDVKDVVENAPEHYQENISDKLDVDAPVSVPQTETFSVLSAKTMALAPQKVADVFFENESFTVTGANENVYITDDGDELSFNRQGGAFEYRTQFAKLVFNVFSYSLAASPGNEEAFKEKELDGFSGEQAISMAEDVLNRLGISVMETPEVIVLDAKTLSQEQNKLMADDYYQMLIQNNRIQFKDGWTDEDACYYFMFFVSMKNIPVFSEQFTMQTVDDTIYGSRIGILVSQNGVEGFEIQSVLYEETGIKENVEQLVTMESALQKAEEKYGELLNDSTFTITDVQLIYVPLRDTEDTKRYCMTPAWRMTVKEESSFLELDENGKWVSTGKSVHKKLFLVNAVTGEEII